MIEMDSNTGTVIMKWIDKCKVLALSIKHIGNMPKDFSGNKPDFEKSEVILDHNNSKA